MSSAQREKRPREEGTQAMEEEEEKQKDKRHAMQGTGGEEKDSAGVAVTTENTGKEKRGEEEGWGSSWGTWDHPGLVWQPDGGHPAEGKGEAMTNDSAEMSDKEEKIAREAELKEDEKAAEQFLEWTIFRLGEGSRKPLKQEYFESMGMDADRVRRARELLKKRGILGPNGLYFNGMLVGSALARLRGASLDETKKLTDRLNEEALRVNVTKLLRSSRSKYGADSNRIAGSSSWKDLQAYHASRKFLDERFGLSEIRSPKGHGVFSSKTLREMADELGMALEYQPETYDDNISPRRFRRGKIVVEESLAKYGAESDRLVSYQTASLNARALQDGYRMLKSLGKVSWRATGLCLDGWNLGEALLRVESVIAERITSEGLTKEEGEEGEEEEEEEGEEEEEEEEEEKEEKEEKEDDVDEEDGFDDDMENDHEEAGAAEGEMSQILPLERVIYGDADAGADEIRLIYPQGAAFESHSLLLGNDGEKVDNVKRSSTLETMRELIALQFNRSAGFGALTRISLEGGSEVEKPKLAPSNKRTSDSDCAVEILEQSVAAYGRDAVRIIASNWNRMHITSWMRGRRNLGTHFALSVGSVSGRKALLLSSGHTLGEALDILRNDLGMGTNDSAHEDESSLGSLGDGDQVHETAPGAAKRVRLLDPEESKRANANGALWYM